MTNFRSQLGFIFLALIPAILAVPLFLLLYLFVAQPFQVSGNSMAPAYKAGAYVFADKIAYKASSLRRGDIVVFRPPNKGSLSIKRVLGLPGEAIKIANDKIYINGVVIKESRVPLMAAIESQAIPTGSYFVLSDNPSYGTDSRHYGPIPKSAIIGRVMFCYWGC